MPIVTNRYAIRDCGHHQVIPPGTPDPEIGSEVACFTSCDHGTTRDATTRRIARIEERVESTPDARSIIAEFIHDPHRPRGDVYSTANALIAKLAQWGFTIAPTDTIEALHAEIASLRDAANGLDA